MSSKKFYQNEIKCRANALNNQGMHPLAYILSRILPFWRCDVELCNPGLNYGLIIREFLAYKCLWRWYRGLNFVYPSVQSSNQSKLSFRGSHK